MMPITPAVRFAFRELCISLALAQIDFVFRSAGITLAQPRETVSGQRRYRVEEYYASIDWSNPTHVSKFVKAVNIALSQSYLSSEDASQFLTLCTREGLSVIDERLAFKVHIDSTWLLDSTGSLDRTLFQGYCQRLQQAMRDDPDAAIGAAKELLEAVAKYILQVGGVPSKSLDFNALMKAALRALALTREDIPDTARGAAAMKKVLSACVSMVDGLREIRALYGTGHGRPHQSRVTPRHAKLAAGSAITLATFLLDTADERGLSSLGDRTSVD